MTRASIGRIVFRLAAGFFFNAGVRGEIIGTPFIPENTSDGRPAFPANTVAKVNPKVAATYVLRGTRLHSSFGTGIRPPAGLELAFTNNPALKPERTASFDAVWSSASFTTSCRWMRLTSTTGSTI
jgi:outer membrane receptor protein involved in Fe transport